MDDRYHHAAGCYLLVMSVVSYRAVLAGWRCIDAVGASPRRQRDRPAWLSTSTSTSTVPLLLPLPPTHSLLLSDIREARRESQYGRNNTPSTARAGIRSRRTGRHRNAAPATVIRRRDHHTRRHLQDAAPTAAAASSELCPSTVFRQTPLVRASAGQTPVSCAVDVIRLPAASGSTA